MSVQGRRVRTAALAALVLGLLAVVVTVASAESSSSLRARFDDPNDAWGVLDVRRVWLDPERAPPTWTVVTFAPWGERQIQDRGYALVFLDTRGDPGADYYALARSTGRRLIASLWRERIGGADVNLAPIRVVRTTRLNVILSLPLRTVSFGATRTSYRWWVVTSFTGRVCRVTCVDRVPDEGSIEQPLGAPSPSETPTPTGSPTATTGRSTPTAS